jgi:phosphoserine phosphatase RsbU/P
MRPGDLLVLFTDGVVEARREGDGEELGTERLLGTVRELQGKKATEIVQGIFARVEEWTGGSPPEDDRTVLVISHPVDRRLAARGRSHGAGDLSSRGP